jgi:hypothetical protein
METISLSISRKDGTDGFGSVSASASTTVQIPDALAADPSQLQQVFRDRYDQLRLAVYAELDRLKADAAARRRAEPAPAPAPTPAAAANRPPTAPKARPAAPAPRETVVAEDDLQELDDVDFEERGLPPPQSPRPQPPAPKARDNPDVPQDGRQLLAWARKQSPDKTNDLKAFGQRRRLPSLIKEWTPKQVAEAYRAVSRHQWGE